MYRHYASKLNSAGAAFTQEEREVIREKLRGNSFKSESRNETLQQS